MTQYRRSLTPGSTYFFTVNLANRSGALLTTHIDILREAVPAVKTAHPFAINAMVILPDHLHAVWTLPPNDALLGLAGPRQEFSRHYFWLGLQVLQGLLIQSKLV